MPDDDNTTTASENRPARGGSKVELDIVDAPFLEEEKREPVEETQETIALEPEKKPTKLSVFFANKKRLYCIAAGLVFLLVAPLLLMLVFSGGEKTAPPPSDAPERIVKELVVPREDAPAGPSHIYKVGDFFVPLKGGEGELRFLRCDFAVPTENQQLFAELSAKNIAVRDSIYYYLSNKPLSFLADKNSRQILRQDIISIVNEHASAEKIQELYIENYLIGGK